jgi:plastocyanin
MKKSTLKLLSALITPSLAMAAWGETHSVGQKDKAFTTQKLTIKVGESVQFVNNDPFFHNVFSLSDAKVFDLGSYPEGEFRTVAFETPGTVEVECAIHPNMIMTIEVQD